MHTRIKPSIAFMVLAALLTTGFQITAGRIEAQVAVQTGIRSIYYYHTVTQGWGDIGYNFLIDEAGRIYKGRYSGPAGTRTAGTISGENAAGHGVTAAHSYQFNSGTVGVALLGTLMTEDATAPARSALVDHLAWKPSATASTRAVGRSTSTR